MATFKAILNKRIEEFSYPYNNLWWRLQLHIAIATCAPLYFLFTSGWMLYFKIMFITFTNDLSQALVHVYIYHRLDRQYDWIDQPLKRSLWSLFWHYFATMCLYLIVGLFDQWLLFGHAPKTVFPVLLGLWYIPIGLVSLVMIFSIAGEFWKKWKKSMVKEQEMKTEMMTYKYESLKSQINPHFLFNSFNVLLNLVDQDQKLAKDFIVQLSQLYRNVLEVGDNELIPLKDELEFIKSYIFLLNTRFEEKLLVDIQLPVKSNDMVVPMVLQTLIENAVKHNVASKNKPLKISIIREDDQIIITNNLLPIKIVKDSSNIGLKNLKQRYAFFTDQKIVIEKSVDEFRVTIPILSMA